MKSEEWNEIPEHETPSIEGMNIIIAEMLGWTYVKWTEQRDAIYGETIVAGWYKKVPKVLHPKLKHHVYIGRSHKDLRFDSDANWQFEAIEHLQKNYDQPHYITSKLNFFITKTCLNKKYRAELSIDDKFMPKVVVYEEADTLKEAIFQALYQFALYLKSKK